MRQRGESPAQAFTYVSLTASGSAAAAATAGEDDDSATGASTAAGSAAAAARISGLVSVSAAGASVDSAAAAVSVAGAASVAAASVFSVCGQPTTTQGRLAPTLGVLTFFSFLGDLSLDPKNLAKKPLPSALVFSTFSCNSAAAIDLSTAR